jgi:hypothetical protein
MIIVFDPFVFLALIFFYFVVTLNPHSLVQQHSTHHNQIGVYNCFYFMVVTGYMFLVDAVQL